MNQTIALRGALLVFAFMILIGGGYFGVRSLRPEASVKPIASTEASQSAQPNAGQGCKRAGCSGQLCVSAESEDIVSTCEFREEYACYQQATCKRQATGECGFTPTETLTACLQNAQRSPTDMLPQ